MYKSKKVLTVRANSDIGVSTIKVFLKIIISEKEIVIFRKRNNKSFTLVNITIY